MESPYKAKYLKYKTKYLDFVKSSSANKNNILIGGGNNYITADDIDDIGNTPLMTLIIAEDFTNIHNYLDVPVNYQNSYTGDTALHLAIKNYDTNNRENYDKVINLLLEHGANPNIPNKDYESVKSMNDSNENISESVKLNIERKVEQLLKHDNTINDEGMTPLMVYAKKFDIGNVYILLKEGVYPNMTNSQNGNTALHYALFNTPIEKEKKVAMVNLLLNYLSNPFIRNFTISSQTLSFNDLLFGISCMDEIIKQNIEYHKNLAHIVKQTIDPKNILNNSVDNVYVLVSGDQNMKQQFNDRMKYIGNYNHSIIEKSNSLNSYINIIKQAIEKKQKSIMIIDETTGITNFFIESVSKGLKQLLDKKIKWGALYFNSTNRITFNKEDAFEHNVVINATNIVSTNCVIINSLLYQILLRIMEANINIPFADTMINIQQQYPLSSYLYVPFSVYSTIASQPSQPSEPSQPIQPSQPVPYSISFKPIQQMSSFNVVNTERPIAQQSEQQSQLKLDATYKPSPGLTNIGNTCFHNAAIQLLYRMQEFSAFISLNKDVVIRQYNNYFIQNLINLIDLMFTTSYKIPISREQMELLQMCQILPGYSITQRTQEDAHEFLSSLLHNLIIDCNSNNDNLKSGVKYCDNKKQIKFFPKNDPRTFFPIKEIITLIHISSYKFSNISDKDFDKIKDILSKKSDEVTDEEILNGIIQNDYSKFNEDQRNYIQRNQISNRQFSFSELNTKKPNSITHINSIMINPVSLDEPEINFLENRYEYTITYDNSAYIINTFNKETKYDLSNNKYLFIPLRRFDGFGNKNTRMFQIPSVLERIYELVGFVVQRGILENGHYYSYIKRGKVWVKYDDAQILPVNESEINSLIDPSNRTSNETPYILLYRRINGEQNLSYPIETDIDQDFSNYLENS